MLPTFSFPLTMKQPPQSQGHSFFLAISAGESPAKLLKVNINCYKRQNTDISYQIRHSLNFEASLAFCQYTGPSSLLEYYLLCIQYPHILEQHKSCLSIYTHVELCFNKFFICFDDLLDIHIYEVIKGISVLLYNTLSP